MKPCFLEFCGINSFSERAEIDFTSLLEFGIFGIFGDTGSGKSTILDCIGFALYGNVARSRSGSIADIINYQSEKAYVNFEFEIVYEGKRRRFRVERELKRKNAVQSVRVYEKKDGATLALAEGVRESNALLEKIVGLEQKDFEKCIALPQGEFAQFVKSQRSDRLKLVSRLFDLEQYGERLVKKTNAKSAACAEEYRLAQTRLEPYEGYSEAGNKALAQETERLERAEGAQKTSLDRSRAEEKRLSALSALRKEAETAEKRFQELESARAETDALEGELGRLERAAAAKKAGVEFRASREELARAERDYGLAEAAKKAADEAAEKISAWNAEKTDEEIAQLSEARARAEQAEQIGKKRAETERLLEKTRAEFIAEREKFVGFSYEEEKAAAEARLAALGEEDLLTLAEREGKAALFRKEYAGFADELRTLAAKYPAIAQDAQPLIARYDALSHGEGKDFSELKREFEARERARKEENATLRELEKRNGLYRAHNERLSQLQTEGVRLKSELAEYETQCRETKGLSLAQIEARLAQLKSEKRRLTEERERALNDRSQKAQLFAAAEEKRNAARKTSEQAEKRLDEALSYGGFRTAEEAEGLLVRYGNAEEVRTRVGRFREEYAAVRARRDELAQTDFSDATEESVAQAAETLANAEKEYAETLRALALARAEEARAEEALGKKRALERECAKAKQQAELYERLKKLFEANKFMDFVAEEYLQNVASNASGRLLSLTDGRYFLRYEGGATGFSVGDNFNGGKTRGVYTLSGGETFLVSLSLALALSAEICSRSLRPVEFFFLDEGFGTLDEKLVDTVMDSLERLKSENFAIGIISHVEELKHRIDRKLSVEKATEKHGSRIIPE